ncbi:hypothetical protein PVAND_000150 [Polypedilum vanderplanki]|uniref:Elongation of very long chain fatty acids protein n=1 Tax=Polypedilum vanderplanki TaxID=319348 RepID=A0A9J6BJZ9_POLVA|nr:hypothetical protein PVAND_000150 [Polypedilum vanderplanki]
MTNLLWSDRDALVSSWPFMATPYPLLTTIVIYLWIVLKAGPKYMSKRKPFNITTIIRIYNILQVIACIYFVVTAHQHEFTFALMWQCVNVPQKNDVIPNHLMALNNMLWLFLMLRIIEFFETIFFVMRKKFDQVTALHCYHHISTVVLLWIFLKYSGGMNEVFIGTLNSIVHIVMYIYYFLSSFRNYRFRFISNLIKPCITVIQIVQLVAILGHCVVAMMADCNVTWMYALQILNISFLIIMFVNFYVKSYWKRNKSV